MPSEGSGRLRAEHQPHCEGWERRYAVKQVATIQHLYAVGERKAVEMFCDNKYPDDPDATAVERVLKWVKRDRKRAKTRLTEETLSLEDVRHLEGMARGLRPDLPKGLLAGFRVS